MGLPFPPTASRDLIGLPSPPTSSRDRTVTGVVETELGLEAGLEPQRWGRIRRGDVTRVPLSSSRWTIMSVHSRVGPPRAASVGAVCSPPMGISSAGATAERAAHDEHRLPPSTPGRPSSARSERPQPQPHVGDQPSQAWAAEGWMLDGLWVASAGPVHSAKLASSSAAAAPPCFFCERCLPAAPSPNAADTAGLVDGSTSLRARRPQSTGAKKGVALTAAGPPLCALPILSTGCTRSSPEISSIASSDRCAGRCSFPPKICCTS